MAWTCASYLLAPVTRTVYVERCSSVLFECIFKVVEYKVDRGNGFQVHIIPTGKYTAPTKCQLSYDNAHVEIKSAALPKPHELDPELLACIAMIQVRFSRRDKATVLKLKSWSMVRVTCARAFGN